jgi:sn-glycerol 3-phosphate transport system substrate-binding protein
MRIHLIAAACLIAGAATTGSAWAATEIDLFFPVPVQGKLANEMQRMIGDFNKDHSEIHVTPVYTGSYDDTSLKTRAAIQAGKPPAVPQLDAAAVLQRRCIQGRRA